MEKIRVFPDRGSVWVWPSGLSTIVDFEKENVNFFKRNNQICKIRVLTDDQYDNYLYNNLIPFRSV